MSTLAATNLKNPSSGSNNIVLGADGSTIIPTLSATTITGTSVRGGITSGTAVASTSGVSIDFTGIPSWVKRVTVMFNGVSTNGSSLKALQIGSSGGVETTGYSSGAANGTSLNAYAISTSSFVLSVGLNSTAGETMSGAMTLTNLTANTWVLKGSFVMPTVYGVGTFVSGSKTLSGTLDRVRITTVNGTDTFDAGSINILYEG
jgi:hypothetical protein